MHGSTWRVICVDDDKLSVEVEASAPTLKAIPSWEGEIIPVEHEVAMQVGRLRDTFSRAVDSSEELQKLSKNLDINDNATSRVKETVETHIRDYPLPTNDQIVIERFENCIVIHACFGNLVNETLALILATLLQAKSGLNILTQVDAYRIAIVTPVKLDPNSLANELLKLSPDEVSTIIGSAVESTELFAWRHWHIAKRFGAVESKAD
jgi:ATP-dependent Lhr-like helicase